MNRLALGAGRGPRLPAAIRPDVRHATATCGRRTTCNPTTSLSELESPTREAELRGRADVSARARGPAAEDVRGSRGGAVRTASPEEIRSLRRDIATLKRDIDAATRRR